MEDVKKPLGISDIILLVIALVLAIGMVTFLAPCGPKEDGSWMTCHWTGQALVGIACVIAIIAIVHVFVKNSSIKIGLDIALVPLSVLVLLVPGTLIDLCMMDTMRCHAVMHTGSSVLAVLVIVAALFDIFRQRTKNLPKKSL